MPDRCVVPGCKSNYESSIKTEGYTQCFVFPSDPVRKQQWIRAIPRSDWTPSKRSRVCVKHFHKDDLSLVEKYKNKDGDWCEYRREKPVLGENAVPRIFPNLPAYLSDTRKTTKRKTPEERRQEECNRIKKSQKDEEIRLTKENEVGDFTSFCNNLPSKIDCSKLSVFKNDNCCIVYDIDISKAPKITFSIRVNKDLSIEVHKNGGIIPNKNVLDEKSTAPLLPTSILEKWSQFVELIKFCKNSQNLRSNKNSLIKTIDTTFDDLINILEEEQDENTSCKNKDPLQILKNL
ncbi:52 kDa repressor of the inhibitor of the protein kinase-like [Macrosteles quadrilineatus]|uniref:52 kDa repressor of the inhibitor of the protein kinase-like n=1 Tax=Macrosteles quadrilineatus TaxID=74068 RepID=UPI0023E27343|nr:52 kDa repressor of the inhibitor of the protein kinase-like [Macrosteles quadrilineatus]